MASQAMLWPLSKTLQAEHHVISADPLVTSVELSPSTGRYVSLEDFYVRNHFAVPGAQSTELQVEGQVDRPQKLNQERLASFPKIEQAAVLECAGSLVGTNCQASNGLWQGWRMRDVLAAAGVSPTARFVHLYGRDGYRRSIPMERAREDGLLISRLNGQLLRANHGASLRAIFPGWYGMDAVKWLERIVVSSNALVSDKPYLYMQARQASSGGLELRPLPRVQVKSAIVAPMARAVLHPGLQELKGLAWSGTGSISKVEVSADGGNSWRAAQFDPRSRFEWVEWECRLNLRRSGSVEFVCRATDSSGAVQPATRDETRADPYANNCYQRVSCVVV